jgi:hypothetical protein
MRHTRHLVLAALAIATSSLAQTWQDMECLPVADQQRLHTLAERLIGEFRIRERMQEWRTVSGQRSDLEPKARECSELLSNPLSIIDLQSFECRKTIASYNNLNGRVRFLEQDIANSQKIVLNQLEIERGQYPRCK